MNLEKFQLVAKVKTLGGYIAKLDAKANRGVPDRVITLPNKGTFYLELKTEQGVVSPLQAHQHERIRAAGGEVVVASDLACMVVPDQS